MKENRLDTLSDEPKQFLTIELLRGDSGKALFLDGSIRNPITPEISLHVEQIAEQLSWTDEDTQAVWDEIGLVSEARFSGSAFRLAEVNYLRTLMSLQRLQALKRNGRYDVDDQQLNLVIERVNNDGAELYGSVDEAEFRQLIASYLDTALQPTDIPELAKLQDELRGFIDVDSFSKELSEVGGNPLDRLTTPEQFELIAGFVAKDFESHFSVIEDTQKYDADEIVKIFEHAVNCEGEAFDGVTVTVVEGMSNIAANSRERLFEIGANIKQQTGSWVKGMIAHEFWHMRRSLLAEGQTDEARYGQDTYLTFEEGVAPDLEDAARGKLFPHGDRFYLAAGLVLGLDGGVRRDFRDTFEALWRLELLKDCQSKKNLTSERIEKLIATKRSVVYDGVVRIKRGVGFDVPGTIHPSSLSYKNGQVMGWDFLNTIRTYEEYKAIYTTGKYDLLDDRHLGYKEAVRMVA